MRSTARHRAIILAGVAVVVAVVVTSRHEPMPQASLSEPVPYSPSPPPVVDAMLRLAEVTATDVVFDLGCGDGRIVITAARQFGARGVCVEIDPALIAEGRRNAREAKVDQRVSFLNDDLFVVDISRATVVTLFLSGEMNLLLRQKLQRELNPGTRIVSYWHQMGDWKAQETVIVPAGSRTVPIYLWTIAAR